ALSDPHQLCLRARGRVLHPRRTTQAGEADVLGHVRVLIAIKSAVSQLIREVLPFDPADELDQAEQDFLPQLCPPERPERIGRSRSVPLVELSQQLRGAVHAVRTGCVIHPGSPSQKNTAPKTVTLLSHAR